MRKREAETRRKSFRVVKADEGASRRLPAADSDPTKLDPESLAAVAGLDLARVGNLRAQVKAMYPGLTDADLDGLLM